MKNLLFTHSGGFWRRYTFEKAKGLGYGVILAERNYKGDRAFIDRVIDVDVYDLDAALAGMLPHKKDIHGVTTFFELAVEAAAAVAEELGLPGNSLASARRSRDKYEMRRCFRDHGILSVDAFSLVSTARDVAEFGRKHGYPLILKPTRFGAAAGVVRINGEADVERLFQFVTSEVASFCKAYGFPGRQAALMAETMIDPDATEVNVDMIIHGGEPLVVSIAEKPQDTTGPTFQENDYVMPPCSLKEESQEVIRRISMDAVKALRLTHGAAHLEAKVLESGGGCDCRVVEVGARCGGDLEVPAVRFSTGIDLSEMVMKQAMGDFSDADFASLVRRVEETRPRPVAVQVVYAPRNGVIKGITIPAFVKDDRRLLEMKFEYNPGDEVSMHYSDYVGAVMATERSPAEALRLVGDFAAAIAIDMH
jgi:biotin carboxylase